MSVAGLPFHGAIPIFKKVQFDVRRKSKKRVKLYSPKIVIKMYPLEVEVWKYSQISLFWVIWISFVMNASNFEKILWNYVIFIHLFTKVRDPSSINYNYTYTEPNIFFKYRDNFPICPILLIIILTRILDIYLISFTKLFAFHGRMKKLANRKLLVITT